MVVLIALAITCLALVVYLRKGPRRSIRGSGPFVWRAGRRELTEEEAARLTRATLDRKASALRDKV